jgi:Flp pilus assembly protein TadG
MRRTRDGGAATVEFVFLGVLTLVPLLYLVLAVFEAQRNAFAVTQAAQEAGRAYATADDPESGLERARFAVRLALEDQGLEGPADLRFGPAGADCNPGSPAPDLTPGTEFEVCVVRTFRLPAVPSILDGGRNTVSGRAVVHIDDYRGAR